MAYINTTTIYIICGVCIFAMFFLYTSHRIEVKQILKLNEGCVIKKGRYRLSIDKTTQLYYLKPMMGNKILPFFGQQMLTSLRSFPIIGCNRSAKIMQLSETSMGYISPAGVIELIDNKRWYQMKFLAEITKKEQFSKLKNFIIILAPTVIIIIMLFWLGAAIYFSIKADSAAIAKLTELTNTITAIVKARGIT